MVTRHGMERTKERTGFNEAAATRFIENALKRGRGAESFGKNEREYLLHKESKNGCHAIVYNSYCLMVSADNALVTTLVLPKTFGKKHYDGKKEIRNAKKYIRLNKNYQMEDVEYGIC